MPNIEPVTKLLEPRQGRQERGRSIRTTFRSQLTCPPFLLLFYFIYILSFFIALSDSPSSSVFCLLPLSTLRISPSNIHSLLFYLIQPFAQLFYLDLVKLNLDKLRKEFPIFSIIARNNIAWHIAIHSHDEQQQHHK